MKKCLMIFLFFSACKIEHKSSNEALVIQEYDSIVEKKENNVSLKVVDQVFDFKLPIGNKDLIKIHFPDKFGEPIEIDGDGGYKNLKPDSFSKKIYSIKNTWEKVLKTEGVKYTLTKEDSLNCSKYSSFGKKVTRINYEFIGKKKNKNFSILLGKHLSDNALTSYDFINLSTVSLSGNIIDNLPVYISESDYVSNGSTFSFIDEKMVIYSKSFFSIEGEYFCKKRENYKISLKGKFIRYYDKNGNFKNEIEQGLVKNNTREGLWVETKLNDDIGDYTYLEARFEDGEAIGIWNYYILKYERTPEGEPDLTTAARGKLLYTETYEKGEMIKREFVENEKAK